MYGEAADLVVGRGLNFGIEKFHNLLGAVCLARARVAGDQDQLLNSVIDELIRQNQQLTGIFSTLTAPWELLTRAC